MHNILILGSVVSNSYFSQNNERLSKFRSGVVFSLGSVGGAQSHGAIIVGRDLTVM